MAESGPKAGAKGVVEDVKGKAKEVAGNVKGNDELQRRGQGPAGQGGQRARGGRARSQGGQGPRRGEGRRSPPTRRSGELIAPGCSLSAGTPASERSAHLGLGPMACTSREVGASAHDVFRALVDPRTYPEWLAGAANIRDVDHAWPEPGSRFHHTVGVGPVKIPDSTKVVRVEVDRLLCLAVRARPFISAIATFSLVSDGQRCVVTLEESALRLIGNVVRPVLDPLTDVRNHYSLKRLATFVSARSKEHRHGRHEG